MTRRGGDSIERDQCPAVGPMLIVLSINQQVVLAGRIQGGGRKSGRQARTASLKARRSRIVLGSERLGLVPSREPRANKWLPSLVGRRR